MLSKVDYDGQVQMVLERLYEDEALRTGTTDDEAQIILEWAFSELKNRLDYLYSANYNEKLLLEAPEKEYSRIKDIAQAIVAFASARETGDLLSFFVENTLIEAGISREELGKIFLNRDIDNTGTIFQLIQALQPEHKTTTPDTIQVESGIIEAD